MKFMILLKATRASEAGEMPEESLISDMLAYNEQLVKAGVLVAGEGLAPSSDGARVHFKGDKRSVTDGPFAESKELVAGFWIFRTASLQEAVEWVKKCPNPMGEEAEIEIRRIFEADDFGENFTPELREKEEQLRAITGN